MRFYYWPKYKKLTEIPEEKLHESQRGSYDAHSGFEVCDLFVERKYASFKQEMANYKHEFKNWSLVHVVIYKANSYAKDSEVIKALTAKADPDSDFETGRIPPYYGIAKGSPLEREHLMSMLLYCNYSKHSASFSRSFRKTDEFESLWSIKQRNSQYFWMAKRLRETVEVYGKCSWTYPYLEGPFYTGISRVMNMPYFHIRLCSPTSTTVHIEVAMKFSGEQGMIVRLNNPSENSRCSLLRGFEARIISRYPEEDEV